MHSSPVDQVEKQDADQAERQHSQVGVQVPKVWDDDIPDICQFLDLGEHLLIGQSKNGATDQKAQHSRDQIIKFTFAAPGGAGARSVTGERHPHPEDQASEQIAGDIGFRDARKGYHSEAAQHIQSAHRNDQRRHHELEHAHIG